MKAIDDIIDCRDIRKKDFYGKILHLDGDCSFVYIMNVWTAICRLCLCVKISGSVKEFIKPPMIPC